MQYRKEIDGLRAIAVLPVILFQAGFEVFGGGFLGVDIFFVISGYLITRILLTDITQERFSIMRFYERRARRILPALTFMVIICTPFAIAWMLPYQLKDYGQSLAAISLFISNILFWKEAGYFEASAELKPMLHTWSLAIEEQYYIFFPLLLFFFCRNKQYRGLIFSLIIMSIASLFYAQWQVQNHPEAAFYLLPARAWELFAGSLCAIIHHHNKCNHPHQLAAALGLLMIVLSMALFTRETAHPSLLTLIPIIGTSLVLLFAQEGTLTATLLRWPPLVGVGLISYSAYLWHQPIFSFARLRLLNTPSAELMILLGLISLGVGYLSWRFVERPFRYKGNRFQRKHIFMLSLVSLTTIFLIGASFHLTSGLLKWAPKELLEANKVASGVAEIKCIGQTPSKHPQKSCLSSDSKAPDIIMLGDSHAQALLGAMESSLSNDKRTLYSYSKSTCIPVPGLKTYNRSKWTDCNAYVLGMLEYAASLPKKPILILAARWTIAYEGTQFDNYEGGSEPHMRIFSELAERAHYTEDQSDNPKRKAALLQHIKQQILKLADDYQVVLLYPIPEAGWNVPLQYGKIVKYKELQPSITTSYTRFLERNKAVIQAFNGLRHPNLVHFMPHEYLCNLPEHKGRCVNATGNQIYYRDDDHVSKAGASLFVPELLEMIR